MILYSEPRYAEGHGYSGSIVTSSSPRNGTLVSTRRNVAVTSIPSLLLLLLLVNPVSRIVVERRVTIWILCRFLSLVVVV
jgi:hypothetical protein